MIILREGKIEKIGTHIKLTFINVIDMFLIFFVCTLMIVFMMVFGCFIAGLQLRKQAKKDMLHIIT